MLHSHLVLHQWPVAPASRGSVVLKCVSILGSLAVDVLHGCSLKE